MHSLFFRRQNNGKRETRGAGRQIDSDYDSEDYGTDALLFSISNPRKNAEESSV
jgi:hypothetical protein